MLPFRPRVRQKRFQYTPRYYDPARDEDLRRRIRIKSKSRRKSPIGLIWIAVLLFIALFLYANL